MKPRQTRAQSSPTVVDVARLAGVSVATVSRVLNEHPNVAEPTRQKVLTACDRLGYVRNQHAASLRTGTSPTISIMVANLSQPWYSKLISALKYQLQQVNFRVVIHDLKCPGSSPSDLSKLPKVASRITTQDTQGVILATGAAIDSPHIIQTLYQLSERLPLVVIGHPIDDAPWSTVTFMDREATYEATQFLHSQGRSRVAFLGRSPNSYFASERQRGYTEASQHVERYSAELVWTVDGHDFQHGYETTIAEMDRGANFDAILAVNDELAIGAMRALHERGVSVPDAVAIVGYGDSAVAPYLPGATLTSVTGPTDVAARTSNILRNMIEGDPADRVPVIVHLERRLVFRESTAQNVRQTRGVA